MSEQPPLSSSHAKSPSKGQRAAEFFLHLFKAARYSLQGLAAGVRLSLSFRQEVLALIALCVALGLTGKPVEIWLLSLGAWSLVMMAELLNTALEEALNLITTDFSPQVRDAKDMASAAVLLLLLVNFALWIYLFGPDLLSLLS